MPQDLQQQQQLQNTSAVLSWTCPTALDEAQPIDEAAPAPGCNSDHPPPTRNDYRSQTLAVPLFECYGYLVPNWPLSFMGSNLLLIGQAPLMADWFPQVLEAQWMSRSGQASKWAPHQLQATHHSCIRETYPQHPAAPACSYHTEQQP